MADVTLTPSGDGSTVQLHAFAKGVDDSDQTAQFGGTVTWSASDPALVSIANDADTLGTKAAALGVPGTVDVSATGTDLSGKQWTAAVSIEVKAAVPPPPPEVASFEIKADTPV